GGPAQGQRGPRHAAPDRTGRRPPDRSGHRGARAFPDPPRRTLPGAPRLQPFPRPREGGARRLLRPRRPRLLYRRDGRKHARPPRRPPRESRLDHRQSLRSRPGLPEGTSGVRAGTTRVAVQRKHVDRKPHALARLVPASPRRLTPRIAFRVLGATSPWGRVRAAGRQTGPDGKYLHFP